MERTLNFENAKNESTIKSMARAEATTVIQKAMAERFGSENVVKLGNESIITVGTTKDKEGFSVDVCVSIKPVVKSWNTVSRKDGKVIEAFDKEEAFENFNRLQKEKEEAKAKKEKEKAIKIEKDKAIREAKKAKEDALKAELTQIEAETEVETEVEAEVEIEAEVETD